MRVKNLVAHRASVNATQENGWTALMLAVQDGHASMVNYLLTHGADLHRRSVAYNDMDAMLLAAESGSRPICQILLAHGANINERDVNGDTPLMHTLGNGNLSPKQVYQCAKFLIAQGADVHAKDGLGNSTLSVAQLRPPMLRRLTKTVLLLKAAGAR